MGGPIHDHEEMTPDEMLRKSIALLQFLEQHLGLPISPSIPAKPALKKAPQKKLRNAPQETASAVRKARKRPQDPENSRLAHILNRKRRDTY